MAKDGNKSQPKTEAVAPEKRTKISQSDIPAMTLEESLKVARGIWDSYAGKPTAPHDVAIAIGVSPTSSAWRTLTGASIAYGLTDGGSNAPAISLTDLGQRFVRPVAEGQELAAIREAALNPSIPRDFFKSYDRAKLPTDTIGANVLVNKGVPKDRAAALFELIKENGRFAGFIRDTKGGPFVAIDAPTTNLATPLPSEELDNLSDSERMSALLPPTAASAAVTQATSVGDVAQLAKDRRVFITHGRDQATMEQIKQVVELGGFEPVVSVQRETAAKPIPEKVMDDMRTCGAAVIHISSEAVLFDKEGNEHVQINPNVLIEIGAAMALYRGRFILVVEEGVKLPSNIQGLYESRYTGSQMSFEAGMKILKALRGLKEAG